MRAKTEQRFWLEQTRSMATGLGYQLTRVAGGYRLTREEPRELGWHASWELAFPGRPMPSNGVMTLEEVERVVNAEMTSVGFQHFVAMSETFRQRLMSDFGVSSHRAAEIENGIRVALASDDGDAEEFIVPFLLGGAPPE